MKKNSIVTDDWEKCFICQSQRNLQEHHIFFGTGNKKLSTKYGLTVPLCIFCHTGDKGVHKNYQLNLYVKRIAQVKFEKKYGREKFMEVFMKNWL